MANCAEVVQLDFCHGIGKTLERNFAWSVKDYSTGTIAPVDMSSVTAMSMSFRDTADIEGPVIRTLTIGSGIAWINQAEGTFKWRVEASEFSSET